MSTPLASQPPRLMSPSLLVSLAATPWLGAIVATVATGRLLTQLGVMSEEIFRGDRLPVLHFPTNPTTEISIDLES
ncbi:hypothetical protein [Chamaesiphon sp.]|uniref:hypothetical protein n=1 Tax=Chamaesiphon sp. TaxID=2814140 RepID=UPI0035945861